MLIVEENAAYGCGQRHPVHHQQPQRAIHQQVSPAPTPPRPIGTPCSTTALMTISTCSTGRIWVCPSPSRTRPRPWSMSCIPPASPGRATWRTFRRHAPRWLDERRPVRRGSQSVPLFHELPAGGGGWCSSANAGTEGVVPYPGSSGIEAALDGANAPAFAFVVPNDCNDMHGDTNQHRRALPTPAISWSLPVTAGCRPICRR